MVRFLENSYKTLFMNARFKNVVDNSTRVFLNNFNTFSNIKCFPNTPDIDMHDLI